MPTVWCRQERYVLRQVIGGQASRLRMVPIDYLHKDLVDAQGLIVADIGEMTATSIMSPRART